MGEIIPINIMLIVKKIVELLSPHHTPYPKFLSATGMT